MSERMQFLYVGDIMELLDIKQAKAYQIIRSLNEELEAEGYVIVSGRVSAKRFYERFYCGEKNKQAAPKPSTKATAAAAPNRSNRGRSSVKYPHQNPA